MNNLTIRQTEAQAPAPLPSKVDVTLTGMANAITTVGLRSTIPADRSPTLEQRGYLADRATMLDVWLSSAGPDLAEIEIAAIFDCMSMRSGDETDLRMKLKIYVADLADLPRFALSAACRDFRVGIIGDGKWVPTQGEIRRRAMFHADPSIAERGRIRRVLDAQIEHPVQSTAERRQAVADAIRRAHGVKIPDRNNKPRKFGDPEPPKTPEQIEAQNAAEARLKELAAMPLPAPSPALRKSLGLPEMQQREDAA